MAIQSSGRPYQMLIEKQLCLKIVDSAFYKMTYNIDTHKIAIDDIYNQVDHVKPWMTDEEGEEGGPSCAFCLLYKLFTMNLTAVQINDLLKHPDCPYIRAIGFLYLRYVAEPGTLWGWYKPYIEDPEVFSPGSNGERTTMGSYVRDLLLGQSYFNTPLPLVPPSILRQIKYALEKMRLPTRRSRITQVSDATAQCPHSVRDIGRSHDIGHAKSSLRKHQSQRREHNHDTDRSRSDRDRHWYNVTDHGRQIGNNTDHDYHRSSYSGRDAERRGRERRDEGLDRSGRRRRRRRSRSRSRSYDGSTRRRRRSSSSSSRREAGGRG
ncbi:pre-mRNA splicing factor SR-like 1 [Triticum dicoccoides]|uniref:pre-mRNA splicing factor SR-like 1 n=1 Tax=Triticum dicoccoides TaxID=85692 RepID=UPI001890C50D|nr:pre-mRNA splicing factor SR-like 1 [Triticum dicoccoides]